MNVPALLGVNPELQRNLWLELSRTRLIAMPVVLFLLFGGIAAAIGTTEATETAYFALWGLLVLWGSRLAADSFGEEVGNRTWDVQRLSAEAPGSIALGKLFGGTAYVWYGALFIVAGLAWVDPSGAEGKLFPILVAGMIAQAAALLAVVVLHQLDRFGRRAHTTFAQAIGVAISLSAKVPLFDLGRQASRGDLVWYGRNFDVDHFLLALGIGWAAWLMVGVIRTLRHELGFTDGPLAWTLFTVYCLGLSGGVNATRDEAVLIVPCLCAALLTYAATLATPTSLVDLRKFGATLRRGQARAIWRGLPLWVPSAVALIGLTLAILVHLGLRGLPLIAGLGFLTRDIALIYYIRLAFHRRTTLFLLILFFLLYWLMPSLLTALHQTELRQAFVPFATMELFDPVAQLGVGTVFPWLEAAVVVWQIYRLLGRKAR